MLDREFMKKLFESTSISSEPESEVIALMELSIKLFQRKTKKNW